MFFHLEVGQLGDFRRNDVIRDLMVLLMQRTGTKLDVLKISKELGVSRPTVNEYISFLHDTFFIKTVPPFSQGRETEIRKTPKVYACDSGLLNRFAGLDPGRLFENSVFQNLVSMGDVRYYQRKSGVEIDFILDKKHAFEVKLSPDQTDLNRLSTLAADLRFKNYSIVSKKYTTLSDSMYGFQIGH